MIGATMSIHHTPREQVILDLLIQRGLTNKQIARHLHLSESTIKMHMGNLLEKYGAKNRLQLVIFAENSAQKI
jgi:DNA-binding NarL/FixJ family response regulator